MKKWSYLISGIVIGALVATSGSAFADQVKSFVGQKVAKEVSVTINGKKLEQKGIIVNGVTNAPVRAVAEAIGGEASLSGDNVDITVSSESDKVVQIDGKYYTKHELLNRKTALEDNLKHVTENGDKDKAEYEKLKSDGKLEGPAIWEARLKTNADTITKVTTELNKINEALKQFE